MSVPVEYVVFGAIVVAMVLAAIERWRREQSLLLTARQRPQLLQQARSQGRLTAQDEAFLRTQAASLPPASG